MRVKDRMRRSLVSVAQSDTLDHALMTLRRFNIRHLPVVERSEERRVGKECRL